MKLYRILFAICISFAVLSCKDSKATQGFANQQASLAKNIQTVSLDIKGMTCEIGCAKTIESKLSKLEGVTASKVDFEQAKGTFSYDANKISKEKIIASIEGIADGALYKASEAKECKKSCEKTCSASDKKVCDKACAEKCGHKVGEMCSNETSKKACCATKEVKACKSGSDKECCKKKV